MKKAVLFDFDGVLTKDATGSRSICKYISNETGLDYDLLSKAYAKYNKGLLSGSLKHSDIWGALCEEIGQKLDFGLLQESFIATPIDLNMEELVHHIKNTGYKTGMVTDNKSDRIAAIVEHHNWNVLFDVITVSAEVGSGKESEEIFLETISNLQLEACQCVFIDNTEKNLVVPHKMGMSTIYFDHECRDIDTLKAQLGMLGFVI